MQWRDHAHAYCMRWRNGPELGSHREKRASRAEPCQKSRTHRGKIGWTFDVEERAQTFACAMHAAADGADRTMGGLRRFLVRPAQSRSALSTCAIWIGPV